MLSIPTTRSFGAQPRRHLLALATAIFVLAAPSVAAAQACPAGQHCFYVPPAMVSPGGPDPFESELWLSIPSGSAMGSYRIDGGAAVDFTVMSATPTRIPLGVTALSSDVNVPEARGVFVVSDREDLLVEHKQALFASAVYTEGYSETVPRHSVALGTRFRLGGFGMLTASPLGSRAETFQYALVTAPEAATITLTAPPGAALPYWIGSDTETHTVMLAAGQSVSVAANASLHGALLESSAPVSAASGGRGWLSPCGDNGSDVLVPTSQFGTDFVVRLPTGTTVPGSEVVVIADVADTEVRIDGSLAATLGAGEHHAFAPTSPALVETSQPALVWMSAGLGTCELDAAMIPPLELSDLPLSITFNASFAGEAAAIIPTAELATLMIDAAAVTPVSMATLPSRADISLVVFNFAAGVHTVSADHGFQLLAVAVGAGAGILAYFGPFVACTLDAHCEDAGPCLTESCVANACVATSIMAGMPGDCAAGLVCSGDSGTTIDACVACATDAQCSDATPICDTATSACVACASDFEGAAAPSCPAARPVCVISGPNAGACEERDMPDAGTPDAGMRDAGTNNDAGIAADAAVAADAGTTTGTDTDGGCGCTAPGHNDSGYGGLWLALLGITLAFRRR